MCSFLLGNTVLIVHLKKNNNVLSTFKYLNCQINIFVAEHLAIDFSNVAIDCWKTHQ